MDEAQKRSAGTGKDDTHTLAVNSGKTNHGVTRVTGHTLMFEQLPSELLPSVTLLTLSLFKQTI